MIGLTSDRYPSSLMFLGHFLRLRCRNAREPLAFLVAESICWFQDRVGVIITPRYFPACVTARVVPCSWYLVTILCRLFVMFELPAAK